MSSTATLPACLHRQVPVVEVDPVGDDVGVVLYNETAEGAKRLGLVDAGVDRDAGNGSHRTDGDGVFFHPPVTKTIEIWITGWSHGSRPSVSMS